MAGRIIEFQFRGDPKDLQAALGKIQGSARETAGSVEQVGQRGSAGLTQAEQSAARMKTALGAVAAVAATVTAALYGIGRAVADTVSRNSKLVDTANAIGSTVEDVRALQGAFSLLGGSEQGATTAAQMLSLTMGQAAAGGKEATEALARLGLTARELQALPLAERMALVVTRLGEIESESDRAVAAQAVLSRAWKESGSVFAEGGAALAAASQQIREAGGLSNEAAAEAEALGDQWELLKTQVKGVQDSLVSGLIPAISATVTWFDNVIRGAREATNALFGLRSEQELARQRTEEENAAIAEQAEVVSNLRAELEHTKRVATGQFKDFYGSQEAEIAALEAAIVRELDLLHELQGALRAPIPTAPGARPTVPGAPAAKKSPEIEAVRAATEEIASLEQVNAERRWQLRNIFYQRAMEAEARLSATVAENLDRQAFLEAESAERRASAAQQADDDRLGSFQAVTGAIQGLVGAITDAQVNAAGEGTEAQKDALRKQWRANAAVAVLNAGLNIALAVSNAIANAPNPIVGAIMGALAGVASGIAFGAVVAKAAQGPPFHSGGLVDLPSSHSGALTVDEGLIRVLDREAVLSRQGVATAGGPEGVQRINRGERGGREPIVVINKVNNRTTDTATHERLREPDSPLATAIRAAQPRRVGSARVW